jgi:hypothetical protein
MDNDSLTRAFAAGQAAWPGVQVELETFRAHCRRVLGEAPPSTWQRFGADLFLCCGCAQGEAAATRALDVDILPQVERGVR